MTVKALARVGAALGVFVVAVLAGAGVAGAHPLGNVSVNHYAGLIIGTDEIRIDYVLDLAELPALREQQDIDTDGDGELDDDERSSFEDQRCADLADELSLTVSGEAVPITSAGGEMGLLPGAAGLEILRLECDLRADVGVSDEGTRVIFTDDNPGSRVGWREVTAVGDEVTLVESDVPAESISERLFEYPEDVATLDVASAAIVADPGGAAAEVPEISPFGDRARAATDRFTSLVASDEITVPLVATSLVVAMVFGAVHSLAPGHGKSVIAAYLIGQQRDRRLALLLGVTVAFTHTLSVLLFGGFISLTQTVAPESLYPLFGVVSGLLFVGLGVLLLTQVLRRRRRQVSRPVVAPALAPPVAIAAGGGAVHLVPDHDDHDAHGHPVDHAHGLHDHDHDHDHGHDHDGHDHDGHDDGHDHGDGWHEHQHIDIDAVASGELGWRGVILPGLAGGLVPSPSALLVFLGGLALGRAWFGVGLVLGYGIGIALTLVTAGWLLSRAGDSIAGGSFLDRWPRVASLLGYLPMATAILVILGGLHLTFRAII